MRIKVLCFVGYYLPGYMAGGPLRTIANMVAHLKNDVEFWIVTRDRDLNGVAAYSNIDVNQWQEVQGAHVYYLSPSCCTVREISKVMAAANYDILYLNSFYDPVFTIRPVLARRFFGLNAQPCIVAPRGEFSVGAFALKNAKKKLFNAFAKFFGLYKGVLFQASSEYEVEDIVRVLGVSSDDAQIAIDLPEINQAVTSGLDLVSVDFESELLKVVFLSRISPMKNLDFALRVLSLTNKAIQFDIYGPAEDEVYWRECQVLIENLPSNVCANYCGSVKPSDVHGVFSRYDLFFFPTRGENYGHVIAESISAGTRVLLSDQTPWRELESQGLGWDMPLSSFKAFAEKIDNFASLGQSFRHSQRSIVRSQAVKLLQNPEIVEQNIKLFRERLNS